MRSSVQYSCRVLLPPDTLGSEIDTVGVEGTEEGTEEGTRGAEEGAAYGNDEEGTGEGTDLYGVEEEDPEDPEDPEEAEEATEEYDGTWDLGTEIDKDCDSHARIRRSYSARSDSIFLCRSESASLALFRSSCNCTRFCSLAVLPLFLSASHFANASVSLCISACNPATIGS